MEKFEQVATLEAKRDELIRYAQQPIGLLDFRYDLEHKIRGLRTVPRDGRTAWVYMPDDVLTMGFIGFGEFRSSVEEHVDAFVVYSRHINNGKYGEYNDQYHMTMSVKRDVAMRNAKKYLRSLTPQETSVRLIHGYRQGARELSHEKRSAVSDLTRKLFDTTVYNQDMPAVATELKMLLDTGHSFMDKQVEADLRAYFTAVEESKGINTEADVQCVVITKRFGRQTYNVVEITRTGFSSPTVSDEVQRYDESTLPEELAGKLAVLSMCQVDQYVHGVGSRAADKVFYVAR